MKWTLKQYSDLLIPMLKKPEINHRALIGVVILLALVGGLTAWSVKRRANREFDAARSALERQALVPFDRELRQSPAPGGVTLIQSHRGVRDLERFNDSYFAATDGGLVELAKDGRLKRVYTVLDGLPESDLLCLAVFQSKLIVGT